MNHIKYAALLTMIFIVSCTTDDIATKQDVNKSDQIQLVARFLPFTECDVDTRAATSENDYSMIDYIIFGTDEDGSKVCVYYNHTQNNIININRAEDFQNVENKELLKSCDIYIVANYPEIYDKILTDATQHGATNVLDYIAENIVGKTPGEYFTSIPMHVKPTVEIPEKGLPRYGSYATSVDLTEDADIISGTTFTVNLVSLYAKMVFNIEVDATESNPDIYGSNTFELTNYTVNNLAKSVDLITMDHDNVEVHEPVEGYLSEEGIRSSSFTFYLPERYFKPRTSAEVFNYPFGQGDNIRPEDANLRQRYKPLLGKGYSSYDEEYDKEKDDSATYVTITGVFKNHQGHSFDVSYDIYVGEDHYGNFNVVRNHEYHNNLTIKGINNSSDQSTSNDAISIDHRVNIKRTLPIIVSLRRETLLDAHFEVRPLRIRKNKNHTVEEGQTEPNYVEVKVIYGDDDKPDANGNGNWIGLERSFGDGTLDAGENGLYCVGDGSSAGKRKYFTYDLVDPALTATVGNEGKDKQPLHKSTTVYVPIPEEDNNECVWIYVDECIESSAVLDDNRSATIRVTYGVKSGDEFTPSGESLDYVIKQHKLFKLTKEDRTYLIEHEEEYLHNFDAENEHEANKTEFEGMPWGLENIQLSHLHDALFITYQPTGWGWILDIILGLLGAGSIEEFCNNAVKKQVDPKYDFYLSRDNITKITPRDYKGFDFNNEIATYLSGDNFKNQDNAKIEYISLDEQPKSAFAYCYNRNKRDANGKVVSLKWHLPAIDEMEDIMQSGHIYFDDFHEKFYWSCQPSYLKNNFNIKYGSDNLEGSFFTEDKLRARATMAELDENNSFKDAVDSSSDLYSTIYGEITQSWGLPNGYKSGNIDFNPDFDKDYTNHPGNKSRTEKCRVRAVYKP